MDALGLQPVEMGQRIDHAPPLAVPFDGAQTVWPFEGASPTCDARGHAAISTFICRHSAAIAPSGSSACVSRGAVWGWEVGRAERGGRGGEGGWRVGGEGE